MTGYYDMGVGTHLRLVMQLGGLHSVLVFEQIKALLLVANLLATHTIHL